MKKTVTQELLKTIINNYPCVPSNLIHSAGMDYCLSGGQRLRDLKKQGICYTYKDKKYDFSDTSKPFLEILLILNRSK